MNEIHALVIAQVRHGNSGFEGLGPLQVCITYWEYHTSTSLPLILVGMQSSQPLNLEA